MEIKYQVNLSVPRGMGVNNVYSLIITASTTEIFLAVIDFKTNEDLNCGGTFENDFFTFGNISPVQGTIISHFNGATHRFDLKVKYDNGTGATIYSIGFLPTSTPTDPEEETTPESSESQIAIPKTDTESEIVLDDGGTTDSTPDPNNGDESNSTEPTTQNTEEPEITTTVLAAKTKPKTGATTTKRKKSTSKTKASKKKKK